MLRVKMNATDQRRGRWGGGGGFELICTMGSTELQIFPFQTSMNSDLNRLDDNDSNEPILDNLIRKFLVTAWRPLSFCLKKDVTSHCVSDRVLSVCIFLKFMLRLWLVKILPQPPVSILAFNKYLHANFKFFL